MKLWIATLVHGNDDVLVFPAAPFSEVLASVTQEEARRGHSLEALGEYFTKGSEEVGRVQFGSDYHYADFREVQP